MNLGEKDALYLQLNVLSEIGFSRPLLKLRKTKFLSIVYIISTCNADHEYIRIRTFNDIYDSPLATEKRLKLSADI